MDKKRQYRITEVRQAKSIASDFLNSIQLEKAIEFGLPEIDDRYHIWRVPLLNKAKEAIGEVVIDAVTTFINEKKLQTRRCSNPAFWAGKVFMDKFYQMEMANRMSQKFPACEILLDKATLKNYYWICPPNL